LQHHRVRESDINEIAELFPPRGWRTSASTASSRRRLRLRPDRGDFFLKRQRSSSGFKKLLSNVKEEWFGNSQLYLEFLQGRTRS